MANIKDLKKRIRSTKNTFKITMAMKLVSAAKLNRAQQRIQAYRPYAEELDQTIRMASALSGDYFHPFFQEVKDNPFSALIVISSDKGLCGPYNGALVKETKRFFAQNSSDKFKAFFIGRKAKELLQKEVNSEKSFSFSSSPSFEDVKSLSAHLTELFLAKEIGRIYVVHNYFRSAILFETRVTKVLPFTLPPEQENDLIEKYASDFVYEPSAKKLLDDLVPEVLTSDLYSAVIDAIASEHGARMNAMESASSNCKDMIRSLTLKMNKIRQAAITTELTEVVSGAESLAKG